MSVRIRFRHFHHVSGLFDKKGKLAGTAAVKQADEPGFLLVGFTVANPKDHLTKEDGREIALAKLEKEPVTITRDNFLMLARNGTLYPFLCIMSHKSSKTSLRDVI